MLVLWPRLFAGGPPAEALDTVHLMASGGHLAMPLGCRAVLGFSVAGSCREIPPGETLGSSILEARRHDLASSHQGTWEADIALVKL